MVQAGGVEAIQVTVTLGRKLLGVLLNVFVPTTILTLIGFSTNFYKVRRTWRLGLFPFTRTPTLNLSSPLT